MNMNTQWKDVAHLYTGCKVKIKDGGTCIMENVSRSGLCTVSDANAIDAGMYVRIDEFKPLLRQLPSMTEEEAEHFAWLCIDSEHHLEPDSRVTKEEIEIILVHNDGGNMLDGDVEIYIEIACRCFTGYVAEEEEPTEKMKPIDNIAAKIQYLLSCGFDLFNLTPTNQAIDINHP